MLFVIEHYSVNLQLLLRKFGKSVVFTVIFMFFLDTSSRINEFFQDDKNENTLPGYTMSTYMEYALLPIRSY